MERFCDIALNFICCKGVSFVLNDTIYKNSHVWISINVFA